MRPDLPRQVSQHVGDLCAEVADQLLGLAAHIRAPLDEVRHDLGENFADQIRELGQHVDDGRDDVRHGLRQLDHDDRDGFDQGAQELDASLDDLRRCGDQSRHGGLDDLRQGVHQRVDDDRQGVHQCHQELDAGVNDLRDGRDQELHDGADDLRQCFDQYGKRGEDAIGQAHDQLESAVQERRQLVDQGGHGVGDQLDESRQERRQHGADTVDDAGENIHQAAQEGAEAVAVDEVRDGLHDHLGHALEVKVEDGVTGLLQNTLASRENGRHNGSGQVRDLRHDGTSQSRQRLSEARDDFGQVVDDVVRSCSEGVGQLVGVARSVHKVVPGSLGRSHGALQSLGGFLGSRAGDPHFLLDHVDRLVDVVQVVDVILDARQLLSIGQQSLHLGLRAAVAQLQVVQHGVVLFCEALVRVLDHIHGRAHLVRIVGHVDDGHIRHFGGFLSVSAEGLEQGRREARDRAHVVVGGHSRRLVGAISCGDDSVSRVAEQRLDAAHVLFESAHAVEGRLPEVDQAIDCPGHHLAAEHAQRLLGDARDLAHPRL